MSLQADRETLQLRQQRALHVYHELLTAVAPEVRAALEGLYDLMCSEQNLCRCSCAVHTAKQD